MYGARVVGCDPDTWFTVGGCVVKSTGSDDDDVYCITKRWMEKFNGATSVWTGQPPLPKTSLLAGNELWTVGIGGGVYVGSRATDGTSVQRFDPVAKSWISRAPMLGGGPAFAVALENQGEIWVFRDVVRMFHISVQIYNAAKDTWSITPILLPSSLDGCYACDPVVIGGNILFVLTVPGEWSSIRLVRLNPCTKEVTVLTTFRDVDPPWALAVVRVAAC